MTVPVIPQVLFGSVYGRQVIPVHSNCHICVRYHWALSKLDARMRPWRNHDHDVAIPPQCPRSIFAVYPCSRQEQGRLSRQPMATAQFASPSRATYYMCDGGAHSTHSAANTSRTVPECDFPPSAKVYLTQAQPLPTPSAKNTCPLCIDPIAVYGLALRTTAVSDIPGPSSS